MNAIEQSVKLPAGSEPLVRYARAYKFASPSRVAAYYFIPDDSFYAESCQSAKAAGRTNEQVTLLCPPPDGMKAGERRSLDNDVELPFVSDGGCRYIEVEYDVERKAITSAYCNGEA